MRNYRVLGAAMGLTALASIAVAETPVQEISSTEPFMLPADASPSTPPISRLELNTTTSATTAPVVVLPAATLPDSMASGAAPSEAEAGAALQHAQEGYKNYRSIGTPPETDPYMVGVTSGPSGSLTPTRFELKGPPANVNIEAVNIVVDVENTTLANIMQAIVEQAAAHTGPWTVKWRLKPENAAIADERVNLTAEAPFGQFVDLLTERVRNMTGTNLFVTSFPQARIIMVSDTYY